MIVSMEELWLDGKAKPNSVLRFALVSIGLSLGQQSNARAIIAVAFHGKAPNDKSPLRFCCAQVQACLAPLASAHLVLVALRWGFRFQG